MFKEKCRVLENKKVAPGHYVMKLSSREIAKKAMPGEFIQILCSDSYEPLLPRPFSFLSAGKKDISILYHTVGKGTRLLSQAKKGDDFNVLGPLGKGFTVEPTSFSTVTVLVGGGVGIPPLLHFASKISRKNVHVFLGARHKSLLLCEKEFKKLGVHLTLSTDDGSKGKKGLVTEALENFIQELDPKSVKIYTCGPTPMLKAVSSLAKKYEMSCEVSVEVPMACGFGACLGCAIRVKDRFAIACCEGPVFQAGDIVWE